MMLSGPTGRPYTVTQSNFPLIQLIYTVSSLSTTGSGSRPLRLLRGQIQDGGQ